MSSANRRLLLALGNIKISKSSNWMAREANRHTKPWSNSAIRNVLNRNVADSIWTVALYKMSLD